MKPFLEKQVAGPSAKPAKSPKMIRSLFKSEYYLFLATNKK